MKYSIYYFYMDAQGLFEHLSVATAYHHTEYVVEKDGSHRIVLEDKDRWYCTKTLWSVFSLNGIIERTMKEEHLDDVTFKCAKRACTHVAPEHFGSDWFGMAFETSLNIELEDNATIDFLGNGILRVNVDDYSTKTSRFFYISMVNGHISKYKEWCPTYDLWRMWNPYLELPDEVKYSDFKTIMVKEFNTDDYHWFSHYYYGEDVGKCEKFDRIASSL